MTRSLARGGAAALLVLAATAVVAAAQQQEGRSAGLGEIVPPVPTPASFVADRPDLLPPEAQAAVDARIRQLQAEGRGDIGVAIVPDIGGYEPYEVGVAIYRDWKIGSVAEIGSERRHLGVLLLIVPKELAPDGRGHCWITTGRGAEGPVTDAASGEICRDLVVPRLRERDYAGAVMAGVEGIAAELAEIPAEQRAAGGERGGRNTAGVVLAWIVGGLLTVLAALGGWVGVRRHRRNRPRRCAACGRTMRRLDEAADDALLAQGQQVEERVKSVDWDVWVCDGCGAHAPERYPRWFTSYRDCPSCGAKTARTTRREITAATTSSTGLAEDTTVCEACGHRHVEQVVLPVVTASSSGGGSGGGGGGGSSFGGSGATSGGGGGSSY